MTTPPAADTQPHDIDAEQAYLGALLTAPKRIRDNLRLVAPGDFYRPAHALIHQTIQHMVDTGRAVDPITLVDALQHAGDLVRAGGPAYPHTLVEAVPTAGNAPWYADRIRRYATRRALIHTGQQIMGMGYDDAGDPADYAEKAVALARDVRDAGRAAEDSPVADIHDFLAVEDTYDWILPNLLERGDRLIVTGGEGGGKSVMLRQIAVTTAAGLLPFGGVNELGPQRVLVLDCENSAPQSRRRYRSLLHTAEYQHYPLKRGQLHIDCRPEGVDLTRGDGRAWLMRRVEAAKPDLLVVGPIYQLHAGDPNSEEQARKVTVALNEARLTGRGCALVMEAHAAKANGPGPRSLAPVGSSLWLRWPEFGFGIRPVEDEASAEQDRARRLIPWRGLRDERRFPHFIKGGWENDWPWVPYRPSDLDRFGRSETGTTA